MKTAYTLTAALLLIGTVCPLQAQAPDTLWTCTYGGSSGDYGYSVQQTSDGGFVVAGSTRSFGAGGYDVWLIRLGPEAPVAVEPESKEMSATFALERNYPNPFNPATTLRFALPHATKVRMVVYDLLGREAATLLDGDLSGGASQTGWPAGYHHAVWDGLLTNGQPAPSGVYIARLVTQTDTQSIKIVCYGRGVGLRLEG